MNDIKAILTQYLQAVEAERDEDIARYQDHIQSKKIQDLVLEHKAIFPLQLMEETPFGTQGTIATFRYDSKLEQKIPFKTTDLIRITQYKDAKNQNTAKGTIYLKKNNEIQVLFDFSELEDWFYDGGLAMIEELDLKTYQEMIQALQFLIEHPKEIQPIHKILFGLEMSRDLSKGYFVQSPYLNDTQNQAMHAILHAEDVVMVYGPPGTGKTTTLVESIFQKSKFQKKILVTASSNAATDLLAFKLDQKGLTVVRIGNIARISPENRHLSLEARIEASQEHKEIKKANIQKDALVKILHKYKSNSKRDYEQIKAIRSEIKILNQFIQHLSHSAYTEIIDKAQIIVSTLIGANHPKISSLHFDTLVIDEASQAMIPAALVAVSKADKVILAGDPHQLPPTVKSTKAQGLGLSQTFLDLVYQQSKNVYLLDTQYRMHPHIASISNNLFYEGALKHADYLQAYGIPQFGQTYPRILFIDTVASGFEELQSEQTLSISNPKEAYFTLHYIQNFINHLDLQDQNVSIAIISPYRGQVELMKTLDEGSFGLAKSHQISFDTIDSFQGQEREMVVLSLVRSNEEQIIGFLQDYRRLNVALTRAQKQLTIIGDSATIGGNKYYQNIIQEITKLDGYRSVYEFDFFSMIS